MSDSPKTAVIGGGITGLFIARELASNGHTVTLFEKGALGEGTSMNSLRIIHGGFRYLQNLDIRRIISSRDDQRSFRSEFKEYVLPLDCYMPLRMFGLKSKFFCTIAGALYKRIAPESEAEVLKLAKLPKNLGAHADLFKHGALHWRDLLLVDPKGVTSKLRLELEESGCDIFENSAVSNATKSGDLYSLTVNEGGNTKLHEQFNFVINASGPWIRNLTVSGAKVNRHQYWCRGYNLIVKEDLTGGVGLAVHGEGRLFFIIPRDSGSAIGTWYVPCKGPEGEEPSDEILLSFLDSFNRASPSSKLGLASILKVESGVLPLDSPYGLNLVRRSRIQRDDGYIEVLSTKYTEARSLSRRLMRVIY